jgi:myo-inositol catabolism protein IolC
MSPTTVRCYSIEGLDLHDDAVKMVEVVERNARNADCVVLGRQAPHDQLDHWLQVAAPIPGWAGFATGRSIWWEALDAHLRHHSTANEARRRIRDSYLDCANYYLAAHTGELQGPVEPEFW